MSCVYESANVEQPKTFPKDSLPQFHYVTYQEEWELLMEDTHEIDLDGNKIEGIRFAAGGFQGRYKYVYSVIFDSIPRMRSMVVHCP